MSLETFEPIPVELFGSLVTLMDPSDLVVGLSPDNADLDFFPGGVRSRPGLSLPFGTVSAGNSINGVKTYVNIGLAQRTLVYDSLGVLREELTPGALTLIYTNELHPAYLNSCTLFYTEYMAFSDQVNGLDWPLSWDDTNIDRVSQEAPGAAPLAADAALTAAIAVVGVPGLTVATEAQNVSSCSQAVVFTDKFGTTFGSVATFNLAAAFNFPIAAGDTVVVAGVGIGAYNGTFVVLSVTNGGQTITVANEESPALHNSAGGTVTVKFIQMTLTAAATLVSPITIAGASVAGYNISYTLRQSISSTVYQLPANPAQLALANAGGGTVAMAGHIAAGVHSLAVSFITRKGYWTRPSPMGSWTAAGNLAVKVTQIPTGPPNIVGRLLFITAANLFDLYQIPTLMTINDNVTTSLQLDFTDAQLLSGTPFNYLKNMDVLPPTAGVAAYANRLFWWGEQPRMQYWNNVGFEGGFNSTGIIPLGWSLVTGAAGAGGSVDTTPPWGLGYRITGDGASASRGTITQAATTNAFQAFPALSATLPAQLGNPLIKPNTAYTVRARIWRSAGMAAGLVTINLFSTIAGINTTGLRADFTQTANQWTEVSGTLTAALGSIPSDLVLRIAGLNTITNLSFFIVDDISIYPSQTAVSQYSYLRGSRVNAPDSYDTTNGLLQPQQGGGQAIRAAFEMRDLFYIVKERCLLVTQDDGINEPGNWQVQTVDGSVGTPSINGVGLANDASSGESWAVIANRNGLFYFDGSPPRKISQEIQPTWDQINWAAGLTIWVRVDLRERRIYIGVPWQNATHPNRVLMLNFSEEVSPWFSPLLGDPILGEGKGRQWTMWRLKHGELSINIANMIERPTGIPQLFLGGIGTGKVYALDSVVHDDDTTSILAYYKTAPLSATGSSLRNLTGYATYYTFGQGNLSLQGIMPDGSVSEGPYWQALDNPAMGDTQQYLSTISERTSWLFSIEDVAGSWFSINKFVAYVKEDPYAPVR